MRVIQRYSAFQCYHPGAGIVFVAFPSHFAPSILYILDLLPTMYSFFLMADIKNVSRYRIIHSHRMRLSRQKTCFCLQAWGTASIAFLSWVVSGSLPVAVVGGLVDVERQDLKLKYAMPNVIGTSGRFCTSSHECSVVHMTAPPSIGSTRLESTIAHLFINGGASSFKFCFV